MVTEATARQILGHVRAFYQKGVKSGNKAYAANKSPADWTEKQQVRNYCTPRSDEIQKSFRDDLRNQSGQWANKRRTPYNVGDALYNDQNNIDLINITLENKKTIDKLKRAGNCGEMAAVAVYVAVDRFNVPRTEAFELSLRAPKPFFNNAFGHEAAYFGQHIELSHNPQGWVVDPWCNICCKYDEYPNKFKEKMGIWANTKDKWIFHNGKYLKPTDASLDVFAPGGLLTPAATLKSYGADDELFS
jgi:hypothetical protein